MAAGERWADGAMRVAVEDAPGAGAIAASLDDRSPEADAAVDLFVAARARGLRGVLGGLASGRELVADGFGADVDLAAELDSGVLAQVPGCRTRPGVCESPGGVRPHGRCATARGVTSVRRCGRAVGGGR
ncbi:2-phosphosulfolactate phosphatase [Pseudonocardia hydrocarbonoxydans]|nr:2-phosphosulfolactate phosphatase [Pseudonocardia hydrocarbonoxydans]